jgi:enediyne biosynthesis protein E4
MWPRFGPTYPLGPEEAGLLETFPADAGATFADVNNNGLLDLYVCSFNAPNRLYINNGDGTFTERAAAYGLDHRGASVMAAFADYTGDGNLDLYLATNRLLLPGMPDANVIRRFDGSYEIHPSQRDLYVMLPYTVGRETRYVKGRAGQRDRLFRNNGTPGAPGFTDVTDDAGIFGHYMTLAAVWWDYNGNGLPDLYVATDFYGDDQLYRNNGDGTFTEVIDRFTGRIPWFSMGVDAADINNNGRLDLMATDMAERTHYEAQIALGDVEDTHWFLTYSEPRQIMQNTLYLNTGVGRFIDIAPMAGVGRSDWTWAVLFADLDNSGWADLFITNGMTRDFSHSDMRDVPTADLPEKRDQNLAFRNTGDLAFEDASAAWGIDHVGIGFGAALGDLDGNGNLDLVVHNFDEPVSVYRNTESERRRIKVRLVGRISNSHGIGATVRIHTAAGQQMRYLTLARGFMSSSEPVAHFGLGDTQTIDALTVQWPSGHTQPFTDLPADHLYTIVEPTTPP